MIKLIKKRISAFRRQFKKVALLQIFLSFCQIQNAYTAYKKIIAENTRYTYFYLAPNGMGDIYIISYFYTNYIQKATNQAGNSCLLVPGKSGCRIAKMYGISSCINIPPADVLPLMSLWRFVGEKCLHGRVLHWGIASDYISILKAMEATHHFNMFSMFQYAVFDGIAGHLPETVVSEDICYLDSIFKKFALKPGKTVLLVPHSNSLRMLPRQDFWKQLTCGLLQMGYNVCTNVASPVEHAIPGTLALAVPIEQVVPFLNRAGNMISVRTGFADITEGAKCKRVVLYPIIENRRSQAGTYLDMFSINYVQSF